VCTFLLLVGTCYTTVTHLQVGQLEEVRAIAGTARMEILLLNWAELTAAVAVGARFAAQLLHDVAVC
jgi:hypothetical protein